MSGAGSPGRAEEARGRGAAVVAWAAVALYAGIIFFLSGQENPLPQLTSRFSDKVLHGVEYGGLATALRRSRARASIAAARTR